MIPAHHHIDSHAVNNVHVIMSFLKHFLDKNYSYSTIYTAKSALSLLGKMTERDTELLRHFLTGAFNKNPSTPKYKFIWDVAAVLLEYLENKGHNESMSLKLVIFFIAELGTKGANTGDSL